MASSPSHTLGEMIGNFFEDIMKSPIRALCKKYNVFFDSIGPREARHSKKVTWSDINGSKHDLDYVIERNGTDEKIGEPIAFIELAWRRYTKHSKNKVQEIAGAIVPITEKYQEFAPFKGAILSGVFTESSIKQLENQGFHVLYIPFANVVASFKKFGVNIFYDEDTPDKDLKNIISAWKSCTKLDEIRQDFIASNKTITDKFINALELSIKRQINHVFVLPLHGKEMRFQGISQAIDFISNYDTLPDDATIDRYIVGITFNNGSQINCTFMDKQMAIDFLQRNAMYY